MTEATTQSTPVESTTETRSKPTWSEQIEVSGEQLVAKIKKLAAEGQISKVRITEPDGDLVLEVPLTLGAIAGGAVVLAAPALAIISAIAAFVTKVKVEVVRNGSGPDSV